MSRGSDRRWPRSLRAEAPSKGREGFTLVEVLVAVLCVSIVTVTYLALSSSEMRWSRALDDRCKALSLARNMLALVDGGFRDRLRGGKPRGDGAFEVTRAHVALPEGSLALGTALFEWVRAKEALGGFSLVLRWSPGPPDGRGSSVGGVGLATCAVEWRLASGEARRVELKRVLRR